MGKVWSTFKKDTQSSVRQEPIVRCWERLDGLIRHSLPSLLQALSRVTQKRPGGDPKCTSKSPCGEMEGTLTCPCCSSSMDTPVLFPMWFPTWGKKIVSVRQILVADTTSLLLAACLGITQLPSHFLLLSFLLLLDICNIYLCDQDKNITEKSPANHLHTETLTFSVISVFHIAGIPETFQHHSKLLQHTI